MKLHQLRYLVSVASEGSIRAAARSLGVTQATVTQGLRELEAHCQVTLVTRSSGGVSFTAAGRDVLEHAQRALAQLRQAEDKLAHYRNTGPQQRLSIGITPWVAQTLMARVLQPFRAELPHVQLEVYDGLSALAYPKLREGSLDLMIGRIGSDESMQGLHATPLFSYEMTVVARLGHPRAQAKSIHELLDSDWVLNFAPGESAALMDNLFRQHGAEPPRQRIHVAQSVSLMLTLVRQTDMLTFCPWPLVETDSLRSSMVALALRERFRTHTVGIVRRAQETPSPAAARFIAHFLEQVRAAVASNEPELRRVFYSVDLLDAVLR
ncbi:MAG: LysR family transcriptional regulator [Burkholderiaceae bacterium]